MYLNIIMIMIAIAQTENMAPSKFPPRLLYSWLPKNIFLVRYPINRAY